MGLLYATFNKGAPHVEGDVACEEVFGTSVKEDGLIALAWMLADPAITSPIIGGTSIEQLNENPGALKVKLRAEEMDVLNKMTEWKKEE